MNAITQDNLYLILPYKVSQLSMLIAKKMNMDLLDSIRAVYRSNTYKDLAREETKLWHLGPVALFEYYQQYH
ncbi:MAG: hypothetical protein K2H58_08860 [Paramuribaculum sp.]|nr:hypothetical protein [Bacteroides sp.]MDE5806348.1 hypothetical protein [Paramuribaculum sp.]MDE6051852.1 hypothetical protein [Paramuribaculum sp.]